MRHTRAAFRAALLVAVTAAGTLAVSVLAARARLFFVRRDGRPTVLHAWARLAAGIMGLRISAAGPRPSPPCLLVANHLSYLDVITLGALVPAVFVAKREVGTWPLLGFPVRAAGTLLVDRTNRWRLPTMLADIDRVLETGGTVILFPEGTSSNGTDVLPFASSALEPAAAGGYPVWHAAIHYRTTEGEPPAARAVCWWGEMTLVDHLWALLGLRCVEASVSFGSQPVIDTNRRTLARRLHEGVREAHAALRDVPCPEWRGTSDTRLAQR